MINERVEALLNAPSLLKADDLKILSAEIEKFPYVQSIRALHISAVHKFDVENYSKLLSETAAYTIDKKMLYQFIKGSTQNNRDGKQEKVAVQNNFNIENHPKAQFESAPKPVFVDGELNRILFEGEEDFLNQPSAEIDIEASKEAGSLIISEKIDKNIEAPEDSKIPENLQISNEAEEKEEIIDKRKDDESDSAQLSFYATEDFLPKVDFKISEMHSESINSSDNSSKVSRHELEMKKLIAEVEAKMKTSKPLEKDKITEEAPQNHDINFAETMAFEVENGDQQDLAKKEYTENLVQEIKEQVSQEIEDWKPMVFDEDPKKNLQEDILKIHDEIIEVIENKEVTSVVNMSFFSDDVKPMRADNVQNNEESNVPKFINTWQNWLKLGKNEPKKELLQKEETVLKTGETPETLETPETVKAAAIEKFIEKEPKISRLSEESRFNVRERGEDISHLMTETLANLYVEQRLYAKAIKAFEALKNKFPDRTSHFEEKISHIKELRQK